MDILKYYGFIFTGSQEHLDMEDGILNSSEETDSPTHETHQHLHTHQHSAHVNEPSNSSSISNFPSQQNAGSMRKASLISLTVVAAPRGTFITTASDCGDCHESTLKSIASSPTEEIKQSNSKSSLQFNDQQQNSKYCPQISPDESPKPSPLFYAEVETVTQELPQPTSPTSSAKSSQSVPQTSFLHSSNDKDNQSLPSVSPLAGAGATTGAQSEEVILPQSPESTAKDLRDNNAKLGESFSLPKSNST
jgi:hypothetical protein